MSLVGDFRLLIPSPCFDRPFVCDGLPESCTVIVIGENPAATMDTDWWSFWDDKYGFDLGKFEVAYQKARLARNKRPVSNTRLRLMRLRGMGLHCLETNVFMNEGLGGHKAGNRRSHNTVLPKLLEKTPCLNAVIAHGSFAQKYVDKLCLRPGIQKHSMRHFRHESVFAQPPWSTDSPRRMARIA
jgi:hypothetical protein